MSFHLVAPDLDLSIELPIEGDVRRVLKLQLERLADEESRIRFARRLSRSLSNVMLDLADWDIRPPSAKQITYAMVLSRELDVPIPPDALRFKGYMHEFIEKHVAIAKKASSNKERIARKQDSEAEP